MAEITLNSIFGKAIFTTIRVFKLEKVLEIGAFDGDGSTQVLIQAMKPYANKRLLCLEMRKDRFENLRRNTQNYSWVKPVRGSSVSWESFSNRDFEKDIWPYFPGDEQTLHDRVFGWWKEDIRSIQAEQEPGFLDHFNESLDGALIDGGEFSGFDEFRLLRDRTNCFLLDDVFGVFKNRRVYEELSNDSEWKLFYENREERNGTAIFSRKAIWPAVTTFALRRMKAELEWRTAIAKEKLTSSRPGQYLLGKRI